MSTLQPDNGVHLTQHSVRGQIQGHAGAGHILSRLVGWLVFLPKNAQMQNALFSFPGGNNLARGEASFSELDFIAIADGPGIQVVPAHSLHEFFAEMNSIRANMNSIRAEAESRNLALNAIHQQMAHTSQSSGQNQPPAQFNQPPAANTRSMGRGAQIQQLLGAEVNAQNNQPPAAHTHSRGRGALQHLRMTSGSSMQPAPTLTLQNIHVYTRTNGVPPARPPTGPPQQFHFAPMQAFPPHYANPYGNGPVHYVQQPAQPVHTPPPLNFNSISLCHNPQCPFRNSHHWH